MPKKFQPAGDYCLSKVSILKVKYEQHTTERLKLNSDSIVIIWSALPLDYLSLLHQ
jgi:hypothetical protein